MIVGWTVLEISAVNALFAQNELSVKYAMIILAIIIAAAIASLVFYLQYYDAAPMTGYVFGMIPLMTEALTMVILLAFIL